MGGKSDHPLSENKNQSHFLSGCVRSPSSKVPRVWALQLELRSLSFQPQLISKDFKAPFPRNRKSSWVVDADSAKSLVIK